MQSYRIVEKMVLDHTGCQLEDFGIRGQVFVDEDTNTQTIVRSNGNGTWYVAQGPHNGWLNSLLNNFIYKRRSDLSLNNVPADMEWWAMRIIPNSRYINLGWKKVFHMGRVRQSPNHDTPAVSKGTFDDDDGTQITVEEKWYSRGEIHRDHDAPAIIEYELRYNYISPKRKPELSKETYMQHGKHHRINEPAVIQYHYRDSKTLEWWVNGKRHREGAPAIVFQRPEMGRDEWWNNGVMHRLDGPAEYKYFPGNPNIIQPIRFAVNGTVIKPGMRVLQAVDPNTPPERLARLTQFHSKVVSTIAAANPNCPDEARTMFALTH